MAAPSSKTIKDLSGKWTMNKTLSDSAEPALALQGVGFLTRKAIGLASVSLTIDQHDGPPRPPSTAPGPVGLIDVVQSAAGLTSTQEHRCLDDMPREHTDWLFGTVEGQSVLISLVEIDDEYLSKGWEFLDGDDERTVMRARAVNKAAGWTANQVWGFQTVDGVRRYCRKSVVEKNGQRVQTRLVYDYVSE